MAWHSPIFCSFPRETNIPLKTQKMQGLFTFSAPRNRNRMTIKLFFLFNQWLSIRSFGRRETILAQSSNRLVRMESIFQETWNIKKIEKNEFKTGDYSAFRITKIYFQKKSLCYFFSQWLEGTLPEYAPSILSAIDYPVYWTFIIILSSNGF